MNSIASSKMTLYISPLVRKALKRRVVETEETMSDYVNRAVAQAIEEDLEDISTIESRRGGETESLKEFIAALKQDARI